MDKKLALEVLMLLSALESWTRSLGKPLPDYLSDAIQNAVGHLSKQILKGETNECSNNDTGIDGNGK